MKLGKWTKQCVSAETSLANFSWYLFPNNGNLETLSRFKWIRIKLQLKVRYMQHAVNALWRYVLFFFNFKSNHVVLCSDAVGNNVWFHAAAFVVIGFNILLVLGPTLHGHNVNMHMIQYTCLQRSSADFIWMLRKTVTETKVIELKLLK